jgi:hypothetical protein
MDNQLLWFPRQSAMQVLTVQQPADIIHIYTYITADREKSFGWLRSESVELLVDRKYFTSKNGETLMRNKGRDDGSHTMAQE